MLGVICDDKLFFGIHIYSVCQKVRNSIAAINKLSTFVPKNSLRCLCFSLVSSHVIYSVEVWGKTNPTKLRSLRRFLVKCLKTLSNSGLGYPYIKLNLLKLAQVYEWISSIWFYKKYVLGIGSYLKKKFCSTQTAHNCTARFVSDQKLVHPLVHSSKIFDSYFSNVLKLWNDLTVLT